MKKMRRIFAKYPADKEHLSGASFAFITREVGKKLKTIYKTSLFSCTLQNDAICTKRSKHCILCSLLKHKLLFLHPKFDNS